MLSTEPYITQTINVSDHTRECCGEDVRESCVDPYISGSGEDFGQNDSSQTISTVIHRGDCQLQKVLLILQTTHVQQADRVNGSKQLVID